MTDPDRQDERGQTADELDFPGAHEPPPGRPDGDPDPADDAEPDDEIDEDS